ncbi:MAG: glycosyltransferase [Acidimicrobiia bacterium]|nr:glycosyltransferase [Acidimicrobiia bacterium]
MRRRYSRTLVDSTDATAAPSERLGRIGPPVRAIVVAHDPAETFGETLQSLRDQDYAALSVTVVDVSQNAASAGGVPSAVAASAAEVMPEATVMVVPGNPGFAPAVNAAVRMLAAKEQPAEWVAATGPAPRIAAEAADTSFLLVCHDDVALAPDVVTLLVDEAVRRGAAVAGPKLVEWDNPGFLQCVGLSADRMGVPVPLATVGEYDQGQHDAVAEVLAVPGACMLIRAEAFDRLGGFDAAMAFYGEDLDLCRRAGLAGGTVLVVPEARARHLGRLAERRGRLHHEWLSRRHQLRSVLVCGSAPRLAGEVPLMLALTVLEATLATLAGHLRRSAALLGAWLWNLLGLLEILSRRRLLAASPGADRLRGLSHRGYVSLVRFAASLLRGDTAAEGSGVLWGRRRSFREAARTASAQTSAAGWAIVGAVFVFGSRHLLTRGIPVFGEFAPLGDSPGELFGAFFSNWREAGLGADGPAPTAYGILGVASSLLLGAMGLTRTVLVLGLIPFGAAGLWRLLATTGSRRAQVVGLVAFLAMPLPYNALANGVWSALAIYGTLPWICLWLARAAGLESTGGPSQARGFWLPTLVVGAIVALVWAFVPVTPLILVMLVGALVAGTLLIGSTHRLPRLLAATAGGLVAGWLLNWPSSPSAFGEIFESGGARPDPSGDLTVAELLSFATGSAVGSSLVWGLVVAAALALFTAQGSRFVWVVRAWSLVVVSVLVALVAEHGWSPVNLPRPEVLLAPAAFGLALATAAGAADAGAGAAAGRLRRWLPAGVGLAALAVGGLPALSLTLDGRWGMPRGDLTTPLAEVAEESGLGAFRILWVGHPDVLPLGGWALEDSLVFATSTSVPPDVGLRWPGPQPTASERLGDLWREAMSGATDRMGEGLAPLGVRYVVVMERIAPEPFGDVAEPVPSAVLDRLGAQFDLERQESRGGLAVYRNIAWRPSRTLLAGAGEVAAAALEAPPNLALADFHPPAEARGVLPPDSTLYLADAADGWVLHSGGARIEPRGALGWAQSFPTGAGGEATLRHEPAALNVVRIVGWVLVVVLVPLALLRRRSLRFGSGELGPVAEGRGSDDLVSALLARARRES